MALGIQRLVRGPSEGWMTFALLLLTVILAGWSAGSVLRTPTAFYIFLPLSVLLGLILAKVRFNGWLLAISGLLIGLCLSFYQVTSLAESTTILARHSEAGARLAVWWQVVAAGGSSSDMLPFYFFLLSASWLAGFICSWFLFRKHNIWGALLPTGIAVVVSITGPFAGGRMLHLYLYLAVALLLMARLFNLYRRGQWNLRSIQDDGGSKLRLHHSFWFATTLVLVLSLLPVVPARVEPFAAAWDRVALSAKVIEDRFDRVFVGKEAGGSDSAHFFGSAQALGGATTLREEPALIVAAPSPIYLRARSYDEYRGWGWETSETTLVPFEWTPEQRAEAEAQELQELEIVVTSLSPLSAGEPIWLGGYPLTVSTGYLLEVPQQSRYRIELERSTLASFTELDSLPLDLQQSIQQLQELTSASDKPMTEAEIRSVLPGDLAIVSWVHEDEDILEIVLERRAPVPPDAVSIRSARSHASDTPYYATVLVSAATEDDLLTAGVNYPGWVLDRYLELPEDMPTRVVGLAQELTDNAETPYEKAVAIRDYLRTLEYTLEIEAPPDGADAVNYFLFELEKGYCQYFASAMTVLLRASGVPSRMVVGYGPGEMIDVSQPARGIHTTYPGELFDLTMPDTAIQHPPSEEPGHSVFLIRDSHSWVEAFFPGYGWIAFEPTPSYAVVTRGGPPTLPQQDAEGYIGGFPSHTENPDTVPGEMEDVDTLPGETEDIASLPSAREDVDTGMSWPFRLLGLSIPFTGVGVVAWLLWRRLLGNTNEPRVAYARMGYLAALSRLGPRQTHTPYEYGRTLQSIFPEMSLPIGRIVDTYVQVCYGSPYASEEDRALIGTLWPQVRRTLLNHMLHSRLLSKLQ